MKLTDVIKELQDLLDCHGDIEVLVWSATEVDEVDLEILKNPSDDFVTIDRKNTEFFGV